MRPRSKYRQPREWSDIQADAQGEGWSATDARDRANGRFPRPIKTKQTPETKL